MTSDIDARTAAREAALQAALSEQRRLARPEDYVFDKAQEAFWDLRDGTLHSEKAVDASIPIELWRVEVQEPPAQEPGAPPRRGRPPPLLTRRAQATLSPERGWRWPTWGYVPRCAATSTP